MSIFVRGVDSVIGRSSMVSSDPNQELRDSRFGLNPIFAVFGELDLAFIVKFILSLFALIFSYNAISGERESGTLKLIFSHSVGRAQYLIGKGIGGMLALLLTFIIPFIIGLLMLITFTGITFTGAEWFRILFMSLGFCLYLIVFFMIGLSMSALSRTSMLSFLLCLFVWVLFVAVIPRAAVEVASSMSPAPSIDEVEARRAALQRQYYQDYQERLERELKKLYANDSPTQEESRAVNQRVQEESQATIADELDRIVSDYRRKQLNLLRSAETFSRLSPTSAVTLATNRMALTDASLRERFLENLKRYQRSFNDYAQEMIKANPELASSGVSTSISVDSSEGEDRSVDISVRTPTTLIDVNAMPEFNMSHESAMDSLNAALVDIAVLSLQILLFFLIGFIAFLRYDVR